MTRPEIILAEAHRRLDEVVQRRRERIRVELSRECGLDADAVDAIMRVRFDPMASVAVAERHRALDVLGRIALNVHDGDDGVH